MTFRFEAWKMAQALSIVGEQGIHGLKYNAIIDKLTSGRTRQSKKLRWSMLSAYSFNPNEFEDYLILAWRFGYVERSGYKEIEWISGTIKSSYNDTNEIVRLTQAGWEYVEQNDRPLFHRWIANIRDNVPTIVIAVLGALATEFFFRLIW